MVGSYAIRSRPERASGLRNPALRRTLIFSEIGSLYM